MTQADSVHSTPPTNTSLSRRNMIGAMATVGAAAIATAAPATAGFAEPDPIFAAIERHRAAGIVWNAAVDVRADFPEFSAPMTEETNEERDRLDDAVDEARDPLEKAGVDLINTPPNTVAGIVTAIRYMQRQMRDDGTFMPYESRFEFDAGYEGDGAQVLGWIDVFLDTIASATAALDKAVAL
jgi:hypothetical protein